jgi:hypothetical protein
MRTLCSIILALISLNLCAAEQPVSPDQRFFGTDAYVPDWRAGDAADAKGSERFLKDYWPKYRGNYDAGGKAAALELSAEQKASGAVVFTLPYTTALLPDYLPKPEDLKVAAVSLFAAKGESEPFFLAVRTLDAAKEISIEVTDLSSGAATIAKQEITNRLCLPYVRKESTGRGKPPRDAMHPMVLLKTPENKWTFPPHYTLGYIVDVHVPADAAPGIYKGKVSVKAGGAVIKELPLEVEVLPFSLKTNNFHAGGFCVTHNIWAGGFTGYYPEMMEIDARYGFNFPGGFFNKGAEIPFKKGSDGSLEVDETHEKFKKFSTTMAELKKYGMGQIAFWNWGASGDVEQFNNVLKAAGVGPIKTDEGKKGFAQICKAIKQAEKKYGWPEFIIGPFDEALDDQASAREVIKAMPLVHAASPESRIYMTEWHEGFTRLYQSSGSTLTGKGRPKDNAPAAKGEAPILNFHVIGANTLSQAGSKLQCELGGEFWHYTTITKVGPAARFTYGFMAYIVKAEACLTWATWKGTLAGDGWTLHYLMPDDPQSKTNTSGAVIPSVRSTLAREGIDDRKYIETLKYYARTKKSDEDLKFLDELPARCKALADDLKNVGGVDNIEAKVSSADGFQKIRIELKDRILKLVK